MTTPTLAVPGTARAYLLGDREPDLTPAPTTGLEHLTKAASEGVRGQAATVLAGMLELELADLLLAGWRRYDALTRAAESTLDKPHSSVVVDLATHRVTVTHEPRVDISIDGLPVAHVDAELTIVFDITGMAATVRGGALVDIQGGACTITATLSVEGVEVASRSTTVAPMVVIPLREGLPLVDGSRTIVLPEQTSVPPTVSGN